MQIMNDFSRQVNIFKPEEFETPVNIIGSGAVGSWVALSLAKMGIENMTIYDFDEVGMHNLPNQCFTLRDINKNKALSIRNLIHLFTGFKIRAKNAKLIGGEPLSGIVFMLTDTMKSRRDIYERSIKNNPNIDLLIETRMDLRGGRIYVIDPKDKEQTNQYEQTFYGDDEAEVSACGVSQTVLPSALAITSHAIWKLLNYINGEEVFSETILDFSNEIVMTQIWKKQKGKVKLSNNMVVICKTSADTEKLLEECEKQGMLWRSTAKPTTLNPWYSHEEKTYINISDGVITYGSTDDLSYIFNKELVEFDDLIF